MRLASLFDGSGGFPLAGILNGVEPVWASEIEPYPIAVTRSRFPRMRHYGNVCDINGAEVEPVDIITFGSPCQDLSVAGKRAGIQDGARSNLFFEAVRIIREMREATHGQYPRHAVWENVPGAFSSNDGRDFHAVISALCSVCDSAVSIPEPYEPGGTNRLLWLGAGEIVGRDYSVAWRTLDAQYWGVPQRRRRIFLVADFTGQRAGEILFKPRSVSRDPAQGGPEGQGTACGASAGTESAGVGFDGYNGCLTEDKSATLGCNNDQTLFEPKSWDGSDVSPTLTANNAGGNQRMPDKDNFNCVVEAYGICSKDSNSMKSDNPPTLVAKCHGAVAKAEPEYTVRRLTPTECARLQGFPDWWGHLAPYDGDDAFWEQVRKTHAGIVGNQYKPLKNVRKWYEKLHNDGAEYKMWGNGIALPCAEFVIGSIAAIERSRQ